jgi:ABC-type antimicrobial peptide transport system permease subunit
MVFSSTLASVGSGIVAGLLLSVTMNSVLAKWIQESSRDPMILLAGTALVAALSCAIPARHAASVDPMIALRCE